MDKWSLFFLSSGFLLMGIIVSSSSNPDQPSEEPSRPKPTPEQKALDFAKSVGYSPNKVVCDGRGYCWVFLNGKIITLDCCGNKPQSCSLMEETDL
jgi:hypothetical protein